MGTITLTLPVAGQQITAGLHSTNYSTIQTLVNGNLDSSNMAAGKRITTGAWVAGPPSSPTTGDIWVATAVDANGTAWMFQYDASQATYKWVSIGGTPAVASVVTNEAIVTLGGVFADLTTVGPQVTGLRAGDYFSNISAIGLAQSTADNLYIASTIGATTTAYAYSQITPRNATGGDSFPMAASGLVTGVGAAGSIRMRYGGNVAAEAWKNRVLSVTPVRVI